MSDIVKLSYVIQSKRSILCNNTTTCVTSITTGSTTPSPWLDHTVLLLYHHIKMHCSIMQPCQHMILHKDALLDLCPLLPEETAVVARKGLVGHDLLEHFFIFSESASRSQHPTISQRPLVNIQAAGPVDQPFRVTHNFLKDGGH